MKPKKDLFIHAVCDGFDVPNKAEISDNKWFKIWYDDKVSILETMIRNMTADLQCGYDYFGKSITTQRDAIEEYKAQFDDELMSFAEKTDEQRNRWCYYDMLRRGVIEI